MAKRGEVQFLNNELEHYIRWYNKVHQSNDALRIVYLKGVIDALTLCLHEMTGESRKDILDRYSIQGYNAGEPDVPASQVKTAQVPVEWVEFIKQRALQTNDTQTKEGE